MAATPAEGAPVIFDRRSVRRHRDRAAARLGEHDFLLREVGERLADRLNDVRRTFPLALELGCRQGLLAGLLPARAGIEALVQCDLSAPMLAGASGLADGLRLAGAPGLSGAPGLRVVACEEALPFASGRFDLVLSLLSLHWVNDLPGALLQIRQTLKPDGLFLAAMFGQDTLAELRRSLVDAEIAQEGGLSPRVSPFADVRDAGNLLQRAGFALPIADLETITVRYADPLRLLADLRGMGETNAVCGRRRSFSRRATLFDALARYRATCAGADGRVPATFDVIFLVGWAPDASQPKPLARGSAQTPLADALGNDPVPHPDPGPGPEGGSG